MGSEVQCRLPNGRGSLEPAAYRTVTVRERRNESDAS